MITLIWGKREHRSPWTIAYICSCWTEVARSSSAGKESTCKAGDPGLIPGLGRSPGEGIGYPLQYSWASLVAQMVRNPPAMQETWVRSLGWEDPLGEGMATHCSVLAWRIPWTEEPGGLQSMESQRVRYTWATEHAMPWLSLVYVPVAPASDLGESPLVIDFHDHLSSFLKISLV